MVIPPQVTLYVGKSWAHMPIIQLCYSLSISTLPLHNMVNIHKGQSIGHEVEKRSNITPHEFRPSRKFRHTINWQQHAKRDKWHLTRAEKLGHAKARITREARILKECTPDRHADFAKQKRYCPLCRRSIHPIEQSIPLPIAERNKIVLRSERRKYL